eukprot:7061567-Prorocentrum_lima.AAC.1
MTSSLVGSEMCIRDRKHTIRLAPHGCICIWVAGQGWWTGCDNHPSSAPVSYTHLTLPTICSV